jgi:putative membrane protein
MPLARVIQQMKQSFAARRATLRSVLRAHFKQHQQTSPKTQPFELPDATSDRTTFYAWQRNHMANERTFLAWCRTGISFIVFGFVIERFDLLIRELRTFSSNPNAIHLPGQTRYLGLVAFLLGAFIIVLAGWRFFSIRRHINTGDTGFSATPDMLLLISVLGTFLMIFFLFAYLV